MASSKNSPGPNDIDPALRKRCIRQTSKGTRCKRWATRGSKLCQGHKDDAILDAPPSAVARGGISRFVLNEQARAALARLGEPSKMHDPKQALMETVGSAHRQRQIWESMLNSIPEEDWSHLGEVPIPGLKSSAIGARIEAIQRYLGEATKTAARASKLAIDAGIEERLVRLAEEQATLIADTVRSGLIVGIASLHLSPQAEAKAIELALGASATHLRALSTEDVKIVEGISRPVKMISPGNDQSF